MSLELSAYVTSKAPAGTTLFRKTGAQNSTLPARHVDMVLNGRFLLLCARCRSGIRPWARRVCLRQRLSPSTYLGNDGEFGYAQRVLRNVPSRTSTSQRRTNDTSPRRSHSWKTYSSGDGTSRTGRVPALETSVCQMSGRGPKGARTVVCSHLAIMVGVQHLVSQNASAVITERCSHSRTKCKKSLSNCLASIDVPLKCFRAWYPRITRWT